VVVGGDVVGGSVGVSVAGVVVGGPVVAAGDVGVAVGPPSDPEQPESTTRRARATASGIGENRVIRFNGGAET
jgi:hypothetical protein